MKKNERKKRTRGFMAANFGRQEKITVLQRLLYI
jgi:hypothetical protein